MVVFTDGACSGNPGPGGWAWVVPDGPFAAGCDIQTTNQRMELTATVEAVRALDGPLLVVSDSTYVVHCFRDNWWEKWLRTGWRNAKREPVANRDLWEPLIEAVRSRGDRRPSRSCASRSSCRSSAPSARRRPRRCAR